MRKNILLLSAAFSIHFLSAPIWGGNELPNIMMTGYWNPTGQMIASFCTDSSLNPSGWIGENWEGMGFNVYSFFPEPGTYTGIFEVDYQDTWEDFWNITDSIHPMAIISYGVGPVATGFQWELEYNARNLKNEWTPDSKPPNKPTPNPPDSTKPVGYTRHPTLPLQNIVDAINTETSIRALVDWDGNANNFLCEYMAYLGMWYQDIHSTPDDPFPCLASGYIHILFEDSLAKLQKAVSATLKEVIKSIINTNANKTIQDNITGLSLNISQNPYQALITISFNLPEKQKITLDIYNSAGKLVHSLIKGYGKTGDNKIEFNTQNIQSGIFLCRLQTNKYGNASKKIIVCK